VKIKIENIGKVKYADIEINGITVIAGENNSGKSTVGKALYSVFNGLCNVDKRIKNERTDIIRSYLARFFDDLEIPNRKNNNRFIKHTYPEIYMIANRLSEIDYIDNVDNRAIVGGILDVLSLSNDSSLSDIRTYISSNLEKVSQLKVIDIILEIINLTDDDILRRIFLKYLRAEFNEQINNIFEKTTGIIELSIKTSKVSIRIKDNHIIKINEKKHLNTDAIYIDDPFVLDEIDNFIFNKIPHRHLLIDKLSFDNENNKVIGEIITERRIDAILSRINYVCDGELERNSSINVGYKVKNSNKILDIKNVSLGLKTFIIIKTLLLRGIIKENGIIILDEPEIHLHPEWQIIFAELIVMIQKEFNMHVLINTHSPYFLNAIEIYSLEHNIEDKCKYYLAENIDSYSEIIDVSEDVEKIYTKLARPFQELENRHYGKNDKKR